MAASRALLERGSNPQYAAGFLFFVVDGNLVAQRFDAARRQVLLPQRLRSPTRWSTGTRATWRSSRCPPPASSATAGSACASRSSSGWTATASRSAPSVSRPTTGPPAPRRRRPNAARDPLGRRGRQRRRLGDRSRSSQVTRSTFASAPSDIRGALSPDGTRIAVSASTVGGGAHEPLDPGHLGQRLAAAAAREGVVQRGRLVARRRLARRRDAGARDGLRRRVRGDADPSKLVRLASSRFDERAPALSPNGRWIAYQSNETGRSEVFVSDFPARRPQVAGVPLRRPASRAGGGTGSSSTSWTRGAAAVARRAHGGSLEVETPVRLPFPRETSRLVLRLPLAGREAVPRRAGRARTRSPSRSG